MGENRSIVSEKSGPKYKHIYENLHRALMNGEYTAGDKLPSENELVEQFGASRPTVSRALAQLELDGLVQRRPGSGTFVRPKELQKGFVFGLLISGLGTTEIFEPISRGISIARVGGHDDLLWGLSSPGASEEEQAQQLCDYYLKRKVSGVFFAPLELTETKDEINQQITHALDEAGIPIVLLDRDICEYPQRSRYDLVGIDNRRAGFVATEHLLHSGAKRVIFWGRPNSAPTVKARFLGYSEALRSQPEPFQQEHVIIADPSDVAGVRNVTAQFEPDGVVCANDFTAAHLMTSLNKIGLRVPEDIRVTGMDDVRYASMLQTPLTTIHQPCQALGATALRLMLDRIAHPDTPARDCLIDFKLIVRQSSGAANASSSNSNSEIAPGEQLA